MSDLFMQVLADLIVAVVLGGAGYVRHRWRGFWTRQNPQIRPWILGGMLIVWFGTNVWASTAAWPQPVIAFTVTSLPMIGVVGGELWRYWRVGIRGADLRVGRGLNYRQALDLCTNQFDFLGTGGAKLTAEHKAFEAALQRCHRPGRPVRFLLLDPVRGASQLADAASRAGKGRETYAQLLKGSLRIIADLRQQRALNIEVRLYSHLVEYRLMFINDSLCLASYNVYGEGDGSQMPQLMLVKSAGRRDVESFYYPMKAYFERLWEGSKPWDFQSGL
jgi:hypothetical protein